jgi:viologen exporter family transport system permease protein
MTALSPYVAVVGARFRMLLQYRAAALAGLWTQIFFGFVLLGVYEAFYASSAAQPMTFDQIVSYVWLGQALLAMLPWNSDPEWREMVRSGSVAYELCRPVDLYALWYARTIARRTAPTLLRAVPLALFAMLLVPLIAPELTLKPPASLGSGLAFAAALVCSLVLGCAITVIVNICVLWTLSPEGLVILVTTAVTLFSGALIPLPLFPDWAQTALAWSPFAGVVDLPFRIYIGHIATSDVPLALARQLGWTLVLVVFGRWLLSRGLRRIVVQGG